MQAVLRVLVPPPIFVPLPSFATHAACPLFVIWKSRANGAPSLVVDANGLVGVNTDMPQADLHVAGEVYADAIVVDNAEVHTPVMPVGHCRGDGVLPIGWSTLEVPNDAVCTLQVPAGAHIQSFECGGSGTLSIDLTILDAAYNVVEVLPLIETGSLPPVWASTGPAAAPIVEGGTAVVTVTNGDLVNPSHLKGCVAVSEVTRWH